MHETINIALELWHLTLLLLVDVANSLLCLFISLKRLSALIVVTLVKLSNKKTTFFNDSHYLLKYDIYQWLTVNVR